jgi:hypothetical protein
LPGGALLPGLFVVADAPHAMPTDANPMESLVIHLVRPTADGPRDVASAGVHMSAMRTVATHISATHISPMGLMRGMRMCRRSGSGNGLAVEGRSKDE